MVAPSAGSIVLVRFLFSDLTSNKLRPAVVLASADNDDWILCQITSNPYGDPSALQFNADAFDSGSLDRVSFARPGKLFTANISVMAVVVARLRRAEFLRIRDAVVEFIRSHSGEAS